MWRQAGEGKKGFLSRMALHPFVARFEKALSSEDRRTTGSKPDTSLPSGRKRPLSTSGAGDRKSNACMPVSPHVLRNPNPVGGR